MKQLQARELADWLARPGDEAPQLLDVREPWELAVAKIAGSIAIPMGAIVARHQELDRQRPLVCICHHGVRSLQVAYF
ncbi:MAG: rhodanese-like domain-containing protein, partial [Quisquiliibacterium sp.]